MGMYDSYGTGINQRHWLTNDSAEVEIAISGGTIRSKAQNACCSSCPSAICSRSSHDVKKDVMFT
jgi:hypothetical protein